MYKLFAPIGYKNLMPENKARIVNGCGPSGWLHGLVPDRIWGLKVTDVCDVHDYMYHVGKTNEGKKVADRVLLNNLIRKIDSETGWEWLKRRRYKRAILYYDAVNKYGGPAFWANKNKDEELTDIY